jgi:hypothetical protein
LGIICGSQGAILRNNSNVIPVELVSFKVDVNGSNIELYWSTATETNNSGFNVERKTENTGWQTLTFISGSGTTTETKTYNYLDNTVNEGKYFYRLKQIDFDGSFEYSKIVDVIVSIPLEFSLEQNFPNPFNPSSKIKFTLPEASIVKLTVYNTLGEEVADLVDELFDAGSHEIVFNASNFTSGIYFVRMESGSFVSTRKIMLMK